MALEYHRVLGHKNILLELDNGKAVGYAFLSDDGASYLGDKKITTALLNVMPNNLIWWSYVDTVLSRPCPANGVDGYRIPFVIPQEHWDLAHAHAILTNQVTQ
jgi:hypothetical protein